LSFFGRRLSTSDRGAVWTWSFSTPLRPRPRATRPRWARRTRLTVSSLGRALSILRWRALSEIGRQSATILRVAFRKLPSAFAAVVPRVEPRPAIETLEAVGGAEFDHVPPVGRVADLDPLVPQSGRLQKPFAAWISDRPGDRGEFNAVGCGKPLIRPHRFLELPPPFVRQFQHLLPASSQRLSADTIGLE
jgi:hypothetical protein